MTIQRRVSAHAEAITSLVSKQAARLGPRTYPQVGQGRAGRDRARPGGTVIPGFEPLEHRLLLSVSASLVGSALQIEITSTSTAYLQQVGSTIEVADNQNYTAALTFSASSVSSVTVTGAAAGESLDVTTGTLTATLATSGVQNIDFTSGAGFTGAITLNLASGDLTVNGVNSTGSSVTVATSDGSLNVTGPITATANVSLSATGGSVSINSSGNIVTSGAVDVTGSLGISTAGNVAAAGNVTYHSAVTATAPVSVASDAGGPYIIPLVHRAGDLAIYVSVGGGPLEPYLFDTGSPQMLASYGAWWPDTVAPTSATPDGQHTTSFASGIVYTYNDVTEPIALGDPSGQILTPSVDANLGQIITTGTSDSGNLSPLATYQQFQNSVAQTGAPLEDDMYGNFGGGLYGDTTLATILAQLPLAPGLTPGFVVRSGGDDPSATGELIVGLTPEMISSFSTTLPMNPSGLTLANNYSQSVPGYEGAQVDVTTVELSKDGTPNYTASLPTVFDTGGGPNNLIYQDQSSSSANAVPSAFIVGDGSSGRIKDGVTYAILNSLDMPIYTVNTGNTPYVNITAVDPNYDVGLGYPRLNPGLGLFYANDVMFDLGGGILGLSPETAVNPDDFVPQAGGDIDFESTIDGPGSLNLASGSGSITLSGEVGGTTPLASLATTGAETTLSSVTTLGAQTYQGDVSLDGDYTTSGAVFYAGGTAAIAGPVSISTVSMGGSGSIVFSDTVDGTSNGHSNLSVAAGANPITFQGAIGTTIALGSLTLVSASGVVASNPIRLDGSTTSAASNGLTIDDGVTGVNFSAPGSLIENYSANGIVFEGTSVSSTISGFTIEADVYDGIQLLGGDYTNSLITHNEIKDNKAFGIEFVASVTNLTISDNTIGALGSPNTQGIVIGPGNDNDTEITSNTIAHNTLNGIITGGSVSSLSIVTNRILNNGNDGVQLAGGDDNLSRVNANDITGNSAYGVHFTAGVTGLSVTGNTIGTTGAGNAAGIGFASGNYAGTSVSTNNITGNTGDGVDIGIGVPASTSTDNPLTGYADYSEHYVIPYANNPGFGTSTPLDPSIALSIDGRQLTLPLDTGSRALYVSQDLLPSNILQTASSTTPGYVYLNSSNRLFIGQWINETVTFANSTYYVNGVATAGPAAQALTRLLVVTAVGASTTPAPGDSVAETTFNTVTSSGTVTITNGTNVETVSITPDGAGGRITIPGGYYATYADNPGILVSSDNFGVGFDRTGQGTYPNNNNYNQQYNAFLNITQMQQGSMDAGYILTQNGVQLGLDSTVSGYAYTNLTPTGLAQVADSPPDWQAPTGTVNYDSQTSQTGQVVIDIGISYGILTLPGYTSQSSFSGTMDVNLINSGGAVGYQINSSGSNLLNPTTGVTTPDITFFNPLAGNFSENIPPASTQFFNTGRNVLNAFNFLYDGSNGYLGLIPNTDNPPVSADIAFTAGYYPNPLTQPAAAGPVTNLKLGASGSAVNEIESNGGNGVQIEPGLMAGTVVTNNLIKHNAQNGLRILGSGVAVTSNVITANGQNGVLVAGGSAIGNEILSNSIYANAAAGILLTSGGNASQPAPIVGPIMGTAGPAPSGLSATLGLTSLTIEGALPATAGYSGLYLVQFFDNGLSTATEGRTLIGAIETTAGNFSDTFANPGLSLGDWVTATATPLEGPANTSAFSTPTQVVTVEVNTNADSGTGSLRNAILLGNQSPVFTDIVFELAGEATTINLASALPAINRPLAINGQSIAGNSASPDVTILGNNVAGKSSGLIVNQGAAGTRIVDLAIDNFTRADGLLVTAANVTVENDSLTNNWVGISLLSATGATVVGNTIIASRDWGIEVNGDATGTVVQGNVILKSHHGGAYLWRATGLTFGGPNADAGNVIKRGIRSPRFNMFQAGLLVQGKSRHTVVQGNRVSLNDGNGLSLYNVSGVTIGGKFPRQGNRFLYNSGNGVAISGGLARSSVSGNFVAGNGTDFKIYKS
jgi:hypothetical protein